MTKRKNKIPAGYYRKPVLCEDQTKCTRKCDCNVIAPIPRHNEEYLLGCKLALYAELLKKTNEDITDNEATIMFALSSDPQIQEHLSKKL